MLTVALGGEAKYIAIVLWWVMRHCMMRHCFGCYRTRGTHGAVAFRCRLSTNCPINHKYFELQLLLYNSNSWLFMTVLSFTLANIMWYFILIYIVVNSKWNIYRIRRSLTWTHHCLETYNPDCTFRLLCSIQNIINTPHDLLYTCLMSFIHNLQSRNYFQHIAIV